jgi:putative DNA primase/helicase
MRTAPIRPKLLQLNPANMPAELRAVPGWVGWRLVFEKRRWTKKPIDIKAGALAETDNPETWCDFESALQNYERRGCDGIGLCRTADFIFIDCDGVFDRNDNLLPLPWTEKILSAISGRAYVEKSITGTGLHVIARGTLPPGRRQFEDPNSVHTGYAFYDKNWYFTFSGNVQPSSGDICDLTTELAGLHSELFPTASATNGQNRAATQAAVLPLSDEELLERAGRAKNGARFLRLWAGDLSGYPSPSEADLALCRLLAFWTGRDTDRMDGLFRQSGLMRDKWLRNDYRDNKTIAKACETSTEVWEPRGRNRPPVRPKQRKISQPIRFQYRKDSPKGIPPAKASLTRNPGALRRARRPDPANCPASVPTAGSFETSRPMRYERCKPRTIHQCCSPAVE